MQFEHTNYQTFLKRHGISECSYLNVNSVPKEEPLGKCFRESLCSACLGLVFHLLCVDSRLNGHGGLFEPVGTHSSWNRGWCVSIVLTCYRDSEVVDRPRGQRIY